MEEAMEDQVAKNLFSEFDDVKKDTSNNEVPKKEPMKVFLRIRPFNNKEVQQKEDQGCIAIKDEQTVDIRAPADSFTFKSSIRGLTDQTHQFSFSHVFAESTQQKEFFDDTMLPFVKDVLDGQNGLVFTYGVTNSGKTYTIQGVPKDGGILPRSLDVVFNSISKQLYKRPNLKPKHCNDVVRLTVEEEAKEELLRSTILSANDKENIDSSVFKLLNSTTKSDSSVSSYNSTIPDISVIHGSRPGSANSTQVDSANIEEEVRQRIADQTTINIDKQGNVKFGVWVSFFEIYNELMYDLLDLTPIGKGKRRPTLKMGDDKVGNPYVKGLTEVFVRSSDEAYKVLRLGQKNRHMASTKLNQKSSRSHCIFTIKLLKIVDVEDPHIARITRLSIVDLAGSERYCKTGAAGELLKEASNINLSIMTLGKCISYLRYNQLHPSAAHIIPFRESKLTRLFQSFFLGKGQASMIVNISQCASVFDETYNVMKFSAVAKQIKMKAERATELWKAPPLPSKVPSTPATQKRPPLCIITPATTATAKKRTLADPTAFSYDELVNLVGELRDKVKKERKEKSSLEKAIREEVISEMNEMIVEVENSHSAQLMEQRQLLEETMDKRLDLLTKTVNKTRKRKKTDTDEEDSYVSSVLLHAEKIKVKERDESILTLTAKVNELESESRFLKNSQTPEHHSKLVDSMKKELDEKCDFLTEAKEALTTQQQEIIRMQLLIQNKDDEIEKLQEALEDDETNNEQENSVRELQQLLESTVKELEVARVKLDQRDEIIEELKNTSDTQKVENEELVKLASQHEEWYELSKQKNEFLNKEKEDLVENISKQDNDINALKKELESYKIRVKESEDNSKTLQFENDETSIKLEKYEVLYKEHQNVLADNEAIIDDLNRQLEELKRINSQLSSSNAGKEIVKEIDVNEKAKLKESLQVSEEKLKEYNEKIIRLETQLKCSEAASTLSSKKTVVAETPDKTPLKQYSTPIKKLTATSSTPSRSPYSPSTRGNQQIVKNLQNMLQETTKALEKKTNELVTKHNRVQQLEKKITGLEKKTAINEMRSERDGLTKQVINLNKELDDVHEALDALQFKYDNQEENVEGLNIEVNELSQKYTKSEERLKDAQEQIKYEQNNVQTHVGTIQKCQEDIKDVQQSNNELSNKCKSLEIENEQFISKIQNLEKTLSSMNDEKIDLQADLDTKEDDITKHKNKINQLEDMIKNIELQQQETINKSKKLTKDLEDRRKSRAVVQSSLETVQQGYEERLQFLRTELDETEVEVKKLKNYNMELENKCSRVESELKNKEDEVSKHSALLEKTNAQISANNKDLQNFKKTYEEQAMKYSQENQELLEEKSKLQEAHMILTSKYEQVEVQNKTLHEEVMELSTQLQSLRKIKAEYEELNREHLKLQDEKKENYSQILKLEQELHEQKAIVDTVKSQMNQTSNDDQAKQANKEHEAEIEKLKTEIMVIEEMSSSLKNENTKLKTDLFQKENEVKRALHEKKVALEELRITLELTTKTRLKRNLQEDVENSPSSPSGNSSEDPDFTPTPAKKSTTTAARRSTRKSTRKRTTDDKPVNPKLKKLHEVFEVNSSPGIKTSSSGSGSDVDESSASNESETKDNTNNSSGSAENISKDSIDETEEDEMVCSVSIGLSPLNASEMLKQIAHTTDDEDNDTDDEALDYGIGDFVALKSYESFDFPIIGEIKSLRKKRITVQLWTGGFSKQWKTMVDGAGEDVIIETDPLNILTHNIHFTATKRLPIAVKRNLQSMYMKL